MTDSKHLSNREKSNAGTLNHTDELIKKSILIENGNPARYRLQTTTDNLKESKSYRTIIFGEKDPKKAHKTLLMVGETGTGKTSLINTVINYTCSVKKEDKIWIEITDDQSKETSVHSQTSDVTVYDVYIQEASLNLTIIDTPGYGDTRGIESDQKIAESLFSLFTCDVIKKIDVVCFVIKADQNRLSDRQKYIFDAIQALFGSDVKDNIVLLFTHSNGFPPKNALTAVKEAEVKCAVDQRNQLIYFLFDNCLGETFDEEYQTKQEQSWHLSYKGMIEFFKFFDKIRPKALKMTRNVLQKRKELQNKISKLQAHVQKIKPKQNELKKTQEALKEYEKHVQDNKNFESEVEVSYRVKVDIDPDVAKEAMCCTICEENCHYPGCWWVYDLSYCSVMKDNYCTVCTNKCHYKKHVKEDKIYVTKTKKEKRIGEEKNKYDSKIKESLSEINELEKELQELEKEKIKLVMSAFHCVETLEMMALNTDSLFILKHIDFLIEKMKEINEPEKVKHLEDIKKKFELNDC